MAVLDKVLEKRGLSREDLVEHKPHSLDWDDLGRVAKKLGVSLLLTEKNERIGILYDVDVDGLFSGFILEDFLKRAGKSPVRYMNKGKQHGLTKEALKWVIREKLEWLFIVDAGSGDGKAIRYCTEKHNVRVVVLDHHPYEKTHEINPNKSWILNVQDDPKLPNLSGCGVVYRFLEQLGRMFGLMVGQYEKFVGITVISDMCDMSDRENRYYVRKAYEEYRANAFLSKFTFYGSYRSFYGFGVIPYLNALIRTGEEDRAMKVVNTMNNRAKMNTIERDRMRVRANQDRMLEELLDSGSLIQMPGVVMHLRKQRHDLRPVGGLLANTFIEKYRRSGLVLAWDSDIKRWVGSFRGKDFTNEELKKWGFIARGHLKACGIEVDNKTLKHFRKNFAFYSKEKAKKDFTTSITGLKRLSWQEIADYNEMSGVNMDPIVIKLREGVKGAARIDVISDRRRDIIFENGDVVTDFTGKTTNTLLVTPILARNGYQLLRA
ncbi:DHH family phosphoesterase [Bacillus sp. 1006-3]|uniref:DHH family phosphoesterase n=1 Tax=Bacillus sp. 1006-3 TaxID=2922309 RepID=UPI001F0D8B64|nr:DHH family phosphoesterase [Bacillus sp. 1006-3]MCH4866611.1 DHH family phosphoesterase [Bacillus sp. 1006-3]